MMTREEWDALSADDQWQKHVQLYQANRPEEGTAFIRLDLALSLEELEQLQKRRAIRLSVELP